MFVLALTQIMREQLGKAITYTDFASALEMRMPGDVPDCDRADLLCGIAINDEAGQDLTATGDMKVRYFPEHDLSLDPRVRFARCFEEQTTWTSAELNP